MVIAAILLGLGIPTFQAVVQNNRVTTQNNQLVGEIGFARSEAVDKKQSVTICSSNNQATCGGIWQNGWIVFLDGNGNGTVDPGDTIRRVGAPNASMTVAGTQASYTFTLEGQLNAIAGQGNFTVQPTTCTSGESRVRTLNVRFTGLLFTQEGLCP